MLAKPLVIINLWALGCKFFAVDTKLFNKLNMLIRRHRGILESAACDPAADASLCVSSVHHQVLFVLAGVHPALHIAPYFLCLFYVCVYVYVCVHACVCECACVDSS